MSTSTLLSDPAAALPRAVAALRRGQSLEAAGDAGSLRAALTAYDAAIAVLRNSFPSAEITRQHAVAWMNHGNAQQKLADRESLRAAITSYDRAIDLLTGLIARAAASPVSPAEFARWQNHLGAAWLNRGHAFLALDSLTDAARSFEQAIAQLHALPLATDLSYALNLAGAHANLAHTLLRQAGHDAAAQAGAHAGSALAAIQPHTSAHLAAAAMDLRARRVFAFALGEQLRTAEAAGQPTAALADTATDLLDAGLALARHWQAAQPGALGELSLRLYRLGAQLYRQHQPHFLADFLLECIGPAGPFAADPAFVAAAAEAVAAAQADLATRPCILFPGTPESERALALAASLRDAAATLAAPASTHAA